MEHKYKELFILLCNLMNPYICKHFDAIIINSVVCTKYSKPATNHGCHIGNIYLELTRLSKPKLLPIQQKLSVSPSLRQPFCFLPLFNLNTPQK